MISNIVIDDLLKEIVKESDTFFPADRQLNQSGYSLDCDEMYNHSKENTLPYSATGQIAPYLKESNYRLRPNMPSHGYRESEKVETEIPIEYKPSERCMPASNYLVGLEPPDPAYKPPVEKQPDKQKLYYPDILYNKKYNGYQDYKPTETSTTNGLASGLEIKLDELMPVQIPEILDTRNPLLYLEVSSLEFKYERSKINGKPEKREETIDLIDPRKPEVELIISNLGRKSKSPYRKLLDLEHWPQGSEQEDYQERFSVN